MTSEQTAFIAWLAPLAIADMKRTGILASLTLAQAIVESNWGTSELAKNANNLFGIKWNETCGFNYYAKETKEWVGDPTTGHYITVVARFRKYNSKEESVTDHGNFLLRDRYKPLIGVTDYKKACELIRTCGYATSPTYTTTLIGRIETYNLMRFDTEGNLKVYLSPSSQENNSYAVGQTVEETVCNKIVDELVPILVKHGIDVKRNSPANTPLQHAMESNNWGANYHIPIHTNAGGAGRGCEVFCYNAGNPASKGTILAKNIYAELEFITPTVDRGVRTNTSFTEIIRTTAPCAYVEVDFHDSVDGANWILNNIKSIAVSIAKGILRTAGITYIPKVYSLVKFGSVGSDVKILQEKLNSYGYNIPVTSTFDLTTECAVVHFQFKRKLTIDGIVGENTWSIINA